MARISYTTIQKLKSLDEESFKMWYLTGEDPIHEVTPAMEEGKKVHNDVAKYVENYMVLPKPYERHAITYPFEVEKKKEVEFKGHTLVWVPDLITAHNELFDWKTGFTELSKYIDQMYFYMFCELLTDRWIDRGFLLRVGEFEPESLIVVNSEERLKEMKDYVLEVGKTIDEIINE